MNAIYEITNNYEHKHFKHHIQIHKSEHDDYKVQKIDNWDPYIHWGQGP